MDEDFVEGRSNITVAVLKPTKYFVVHAYDYRRIIGDVFKGTEKISKGHFFVDKFQFIVLETETEVDVGNYTLRFEFYYLLRNDLKGFYYSKYKDTAGKDK